jgi:hypothetical protein
MWVYVRFRQSLAYDARHIIHNILNPRFLSVMAFYDLASGICQAPGIYCLTRHPTRSGPSFPDLNGIL